MRLTITVHGAPYASQAALSAQRFVSAALTRGHSIERVFFYHDGVRIADDLAVQPQEDASLIDAWQALQREHSIELAICIAASLKRGILNEEECRRYDKSAASLAEGFEIVGLGQLIDAINQADRVVTFAA